MYTHGLATICLCEAYGLSGDTTVGGPAQQAINFICKAQNASTGGWRYEPGDRAIPRSSAGRSWASRAD